MVKHGPDLAFQTKGIRALRNALKHVFVSKQTPSNRPCITNHAFAYRLNERQESQDPILRTLRETQLKVLLFLQTKHFSLIRLQVHQTLQVNNISL